MSWDGSIMFHYSSSMTFLTQENTCVWLSGLSFEKFVLVGGKLGKTKRCRTQEAQVPGRMRSILF